MQPPKTLAVAAETTKSPGGFGLEAELGREAVKGDAAAITAVTPTKGSFGLDAEVDVHKMPLKEVNRELETGDAAAAVSATGAENADGGYRGVADASEFRAATTGFLAARQKQLATVPQLTADGVRQSMATLPVSPTQGFKPKRTIDVSKSRVVELAAVAHGQSSHLEAWEQFASRQGARYTPLLNRGLHEMLPHTMGYRLRLAALHKLTIGPLAAEAKARGNSLEMRLGVSLYDEATGCFYGNTCNSLPCIPLPLLPTPPEPLDLDIQQDVYFHTRLLDPRCLLVIEVVLVEKTEHTTVQEVSLGWAALNTVQRPSKGDAPGANVQVSIKRGSPRYLMWGMPRTGHPPPKSLEGSRLLFCLEACQAFVQAAPFLPRDFLVTYSDVVPGLGRFDFDGRPTYKVTSNVVSSLANPLVSPPLCVRLSNLCVALPKGLYPTLAKLAHKSEPPQFQLRLAVHNGRAFVGRPVLTRAVHFDEASNMLEVTEDVYVRGIPLDILVVLRVEVQVLSESFPPGCFGWAPFLFCKPPATPLPPGTDVMAALSGTQSLCEGNYEVALRSTGRAWLRDEPLLDWRGLMDETPSAEVEQLPPPTAYFQLEMVDVAHAPEPAEEPVPSSASTAVRMSDEEAATKIQSRFRGHQARKSGPAVKRSATLAARPSPPKPVPVPPVAGAPLPETVDMRASQAHLLQAMAAAGTPNEDAQKQLVNLALAMQAQITQLTDAVRTLQTQAAAPVPTPSPVAPVTAAPVMVAGAGRTGAPYDAAAALAASSAAAEVEALASAAAAAAAGSAVKFAGAAEPPSSTGASGPSRAVRAALHESGQHGGLPADVRAMLKRKPIVKPSAHTDVSLEARDLRVQSEVIVQLAAYKSHDAFNVPTSLKTLYFTFQFFDFPPTTTERLSLGDANSAEFGEAMRLLIRQAATGGDASVPGLLLKYLVGGGSKGAVVDDRAESEEAQARRMAFCHYLKNRALSIDVFDGESLLQIGTLTVDLQALLRQGREFAEVLVECPVVDHREALPDDAARNRRRRGAIRAALGPGAAQGAGGPATVARGVLVLRLINIGRAVSHLTRLPPAGLDPRRSPVSMLHKGNNHLRRVRAVPEQGAAALAVQATPVVATTAAGRRPLSARALADSMRSEMTQQVARKAKRQQRLQELRTGQALPQPYPEEEERSVRERMLNDISSQRMQKKHEMVARQLRSGLCSTVVLRPLYGEVLFFEHEFRNPSATDAVFVVETSSPDLVLVTDAAEWRVLRVAARLPGGAAAAEDDAVAQGNRLFLVGGETVRVPFKFLSLDPAAHMGPAFQGAPGASMLDCHDQRLPRRSLTVMMVHESDSVPASVLEVDVRPAPLCVDRTFRFHAAEHEFFKQRLKLPHADAAVDTGPGGASAAELTAVCSEATAVVGCTAAEAGGVQDEVYLKVKCGAAPTTSELFVLLYRDRFCARLVATWQVFVHSLRRTDMTAVVGQTTQSSVVVRGQAASRRVAVFSSHPDELQVAPDSLLLVGGALTELMLSFRPLVPGRLDALVHVVDTESHELVHALMVATEARTPTITKSFEVALTAGVATHKKISYTNPYAAARSFYLRSTHPWLVTFRPERLDLPPHGSKHVGLTFAAPDHCVASATAALDGAAVEVLVFINDDEDKNEECFRIRVDIQ